MNSIDQLGVLLKSGPRGGKYYKRVAKPGGGYRYYYTKEEYETKHAPTRKPFEEVGIVQHETDKKLIAMPTPHYGSTYSHEVFYDGTKIGFLSPSGTLDKFVQGFPKGIKDIKRMASQEQKTKGRDLLSELNEMVKKSEESNMSEETLERPDPNSMSKGMYSFYNQENAKEIPEMYLMDLVHAFIEEAFEHESKECSTNEMNLEGQDRYAQVAVGVYNELVQCAQFNPNLRRALEKYTGVLNEAYVRNHLESQGMVFTRNENYTADKMAQVAGYHPTRMAMSQYNPNVGPSTLEKAEEPMIQLPDGDEDPMQSLHGYHRGLKKALRHEHLQSEQEISPLDNDDPHIVDPNKA